jgi:hypothetical protein
MFYINEAISKRFGRCGSTSSPTAYRSAKVPTASYNGFETASNVKQVKNRATASTTL